MKVRIYPKSLLETVWQQDKLLFTPEAEQPPLCLRCGQTLDRRLVINALSAPRPTKETLIWWLCQGCGVEGWPGLGLARLPLAPAIPSDLPLWGRCGRFRAGYRRAVTPPGRRPGPASASSSWRTGPADGCGSWPGRGSGS